MSQLPAGLSYNIRFHDDHKHTIKLLHCKQSQRILKKCSNAVVFSAQAVKEHVEHACGKKRFCFTTACREVKQVRGFNVRFRNIGIIFILAANHLADKRNDKNDLEQTPTANLSVFTSEFRHKGFVHINKRLFNKIPVLNLINALPKTANFMLIVL